MAETRLSLQLANMPINVACSYTTKPQKRSMYKCSYYTCVHHQVASGRYTFFSLLPLAILAIYITKVAVVEPERSANSMTSVPIQSGAMSRTLMQQGYTEDMAVWRFRWRWRWSGQISVRSER